MSSSDDPARLRERIRELEDELARVRGNAPSKGYAEFMNALPQVVFETDLQGRFRFANEFGLSLFGFTPADVEAGITVMDVIIPEDRAQAAERMQAAIRDQNTSAARYTACTKAGRTFPALIHTRPVYRNGQPDGIVGILIDITDLTSAESALGEQTDRISAIVRAIPDIIFVLDGDGRYIDILTDEDDLLYKEREKLIGTRLHDMLPANVADLALSAIREALASGQSRVVEYSLDVQAGPRWFEGRTAAIPNPTGGPSEHVVFAAHDITPRKEAELALTRARDELEERVVERTAQLSASEERYRSLFETTQDIVATFEPDGTITSLNPAFEHVLGWNSAEWIGRSCLKLVHPDDLDATRASIKALGTGQKRFAINVRRLKTRDGRYIPIDISSAPLVRDGQIVGIVSTLRDISERVAAQEALEESEERYRSLVENAPDIILTATPEGNFSSLNPAFETVLGYQRRERLGRNYAEIVHPDDLPAAQKAMVTLLAGRPVPNLIQRVRHAHGEYMYIETSMAPIIHDGKVIAITALVRDVTERKRTEEALIQAERMSAVGTLSAGVAHEFNNIHTSILGFLEMILEDTLAEQSRPLLERVHRATLRASRVTRNLLAFARPEKTRHLRENLNDIVDDILGLIRSEFESEGVRIDVRPGDVPSVDMDAAQIGQVIMNLLINAHHSTLGASVRRIGIETGAIDNRVFVRVRDSGCGIPEEEQGKIFLPFFTTKGEHAETGAPQRQVRGTGLGLSVCDTIVRNHGGIIKVESKVGHGSIFTVWLPRKTSTRIRPRQAPDAPPDLTGQTVLVLDDEEDVQDLLQGILERTGAAIFCTDDGEEALRLHEQHRFALALVDIQMPKLAGDKFLHRVRKMKRAPACVVITGRPAAAVGDVFINEIVLHKPFELTELYRALYEALGAD